MVRVTLSAVADFAEADAGDSQAADEGIETVA
jgi:hypothetical protein